MTTLSDPAPPVTRLLAEFVATYDQARIPAKTRREAVRSLVNWLGCAVGGSTHPAVGIVRTAFAPHVGEDRFTVPGLDRRTDLFTAALLQGIASHVLDFDDTHLRTIVHPAGPVLSAALPLAEELDASGWRLLDALIVGVEVECRIANAIYPEHYDIGWHITGTTGVLGAAAAGARLLRLDADRTVHALGIAATQSSGFREMFGSMCKSFHVGAAARNGLQAALLAAQGFTSSTRSIEAPRGLVNVMSSARRYDEITAGLGETWQIEENTYKPFACGIVIHPAIDACIQLSRSHGLDPAEIEAIELSVHPLVLELTGIRAPSTGLEGKFSVFHAAAVGYIRHRADADAFSDAAVNDREIVALRDRVVANVFRDCREDEVHVTLATRDGRRVTLHVPHALGSLARPLSDPQLDAKFASLAAPVLGDKGSQRLLYASRDVVGTPFVRDLADLSRPPLQSPA